MFIPCSPEEHSEAFQNGSTSSLRRLIRTASEESAFPEFVCTRSICEFRNNGGHVDAPADKANKLPFSPQLNFHFLPYSKNRRAYATTCGAKLEAICRPALFSVYARAPPCKTSSFRIFINGVFGWRSILRRHFGLSAFALSPHLVEQQKSLASNMYYSAALSEGHFRCFITRLMNKSCWFHILGQIGRSIHASPLIKSQHE